MNLRRTLTTTDAVVVGLAAMIGAGVFVVFAPAAEAAGDALLLALAAAAVVAYANATSSARLAARYPEAGGTYVYGRERLGPFWGYVAGWSFVVGKTASCAAMAVTVGLYVWPGQEYLVAVAAVVALTALNFAGVQRSARVTRAAVAVVVAVLLAVVAVSLLNPAGAVPVSDDGATGPLGVLQAAGLLFFAFAGYARIATLGEEVRDPSRAIPRAIAVALLVALGLYALVAVALLRVLGSGGLARATAPLVEAVQVAGAGGLAPVVRVAAALAALGALLALILGVSRTTLAMARDRHLPAPLAVVHPSGVPRHAELAVGGVVAVVAALMDVRAAIGFSSFGVLVYYAIANASAWTLRRAEGGPPRVVSAVGLGGCLVLAFTLPTTAVLAGVGVLALGVLAYVLGARRRRAAA
ncbi:amino acid permease-associated region [Beutenbergia cavernae DSM 12333]|uniref:Amino acid permease-associated region n=1 Tax=Beutenbergia cavernae (strain ATCC BAA-8 / DSM 12333 / CCUG 43141 / JCM 11478 / NBRC 16432 / NCIMB 13614 / HKI 0122) TaxID=471853 RepID=C5BVS8_BEUC1|nr:APC family permease [Beutenbergia cavernae]ACQ78518.1 amino acid permease-associated region [Beutenbergia cavernae DSM 12333]